LKKNTNHFWIDESVAHSRIPISGNLKNSSFFKIKGEGQFWDLQNFGGAGKKCRGVGRRSQKNIGGCFFLHPHIFLPAPPQSCAKTKLPFKIFEITKLPLM